MQYARTLVSIVDLRAVSKYCYYFLFAPISGIHSFQVLLFRVCYGMKLCCCALCVWSERPYVLVEWSCCQGLNVVEKLQQRNTSKYNFANSLLAVLPHLSLHAFFWCFTSFTG